MLHWSPRSRLRYACRQRRVIDIATARAVVRRVSYKCNELITSDINRASGYRHHAALSPERRDPEGESRRDLAVGERSVTHGMNRKEIMRLKDANCRLND